MKRLVRLLGLASLVVLASACEPKSAVTVPTYSGITLVPDKEVYEVGDKVVCSIELQTMGSDNLQAATYWWYASWWFTDPALTADFQEFADVDGKQICTSSEILLTEAGEVTLYFFGRLEYPEWDFRKIEIPVTLTVIEKAEE